MIFRKTKKDNLMKKGSTYIDKVNKLRCFCFYKVIGNVIFALMRKKFATREGNNFEKMDHNR